MIALNTIIKWIELRAKLIRRKDTLADVVIDVSGFADIACTIWGVDIAIGYSVMNWNALETH